MTRRAVFMEGLRLHGAHPEIGALYPTSRAGRTNGQKRTFYSQFDRVFTARAAAEARFGRHPSFAKICARCLSTVRGLMVESPRSRRFDLPAAHPQQHLRLARSLMASVFCSTSSSTTHGALRKPEQPLIGPDGAHHGNLQPRGPNLQHGTRQRAGRRPLLPQPDELRR